MFVSVSSDLMRFHALCVVPLKISNYRPYTSIPCIIYMGPLSPEQNLDTSARVFIVQKT